MNKKTEIDRTIEEIREMRLRYDLTHIIFAFPRVKSELDDDWKDPAGFVTGCIAAANKSQHPRDKNLPLSVKGIEQIEFDVTIPNVKRLMNFGVFTITRNKRGFRIALPPEVREIQGKSCIAIVGVPPFHLGYTAKMEIILQGQRTSKALSEELFPRNKWIDLPNRRIKELKNSSSVTRKDKEDTRSFLWMGQNRRCAACGKQIGIGEATLEHELPKAMHGPNTITNLSVTCRRCNEEKGDSLPFGLTADDLRWSNYIPHNGLSIPKNSNNLKNQNLEP